MAYKAPIWEDGKSPAISAENLNNLSQAAEGAQVLYGNSAPTSSTKGAVGQLYLVAVADSDGNYPLYQCVAIANGSYVWRDTRRIPDSITSMLGIPAPGTINSALNVLAHVGNLHVWERVQDGVTDYLTSTDRNAYPDNVTDAQDAYYTLGDVVTGSFRMSSLVPRNAYLYEYSNSVKVNENGDVFLQNPEAVNFNFESYIGYESTVLSLVAGKFLRYVGRDSMVDGSSAPDTQPPFNATPSEIIYVPADAVITGIDTYPDGFYLDKYQPVTGHAAIPANTTITYLGQLGKPGAKIEVGSYVGTGTYGSSNPNSLTFGFKPKLLWILGTYTNRKNGTSGYLNPIMFSGTYKCISIISKVSVGAFSEDGIISDGAPEDYPADAHAMLSTDGKTYSWYNDGNAGKQFNSSNIEYHYIAIG